MTTLGFIGLGRMGEPIALNLLRAGLRLVVWNRSEPALSRLVAAGAHRAASSQEVLRRCQTTFLMLANEQAADVVLGRGSPEFARDIRGRAIVHMGTTSPDYSARLGAEIEAAGGTYVEAPVSGSRVPAEQGQLIGMVAGTPVAVAAVRDLMEPICAETFACGHVPNALRMKLAVNLFLITLVTGLVEASHFAANIGLDLELFQAVINAGPMASSVGKGKLDKIVRKDLTPQASLGDVLMNNTLIATTARHAHIVTPLLDQCHRLFHEAEMSGLGNVDMIGVMAALEFHTSACRMSPHPEEA